MRRNQSITKNIWHKEQDWTQNGHSGHLDQYFSRKTKTFVAVMPQQLQEMIKAKGEPIDN